MGLSNEHAADSTDQAGENNDDGYRLLNVELGTAAVVALLFLVLRLLAVAHWDWHSVGAIADTFDFGDSFAVAFGTIAVQPWITGIFTAVLLPLILIRLFWPVSANRGPIRVSTILGAVALAVIAFAMTVTYRNPWTLLGAVGVGAVLVLIRVFARSPRLRRAVSVVTGRIALITVVGVLALAVVDDEPWMARERITTTGDHGVIDGYVLEAEPGFLHILTGDREVLIIPAGEVTGRVILD